MAAILESDGLYKSFGRHAAIVDVSLRLFEGETFGFLGENGAGKSTFVQMICGVLPPDKGGISLFGRRATRVPAAWRAEIGYVAQEPRFDPWMSAEELGGFLAPFFPAHDKAFYASLLKRLDVPPRQRIETLSVGQRARLAVAAALAHRPALLILDEPTAGLDPLARRELHELLKETAAENPRATFFSSHIVDDVVHLATRVGVLDRGRLIYNGTPAGLASSVRVIDRVDRRHLPPLATVLRTTASQLVVKAAPADWEKFTGTDHFATPAEKQQDFAAPAEKQPQDFAAPAEKQRDFAAPAEKQQDFAAPAEKQQDFAAPAKQQDLDEDDDAVAVADAATEDVAVAPPAARRLVAHSLSFEDALLALLASRRAT